MKLVSLFIYFFKLVTKLSRISGFENFPDAILGKASSKIIMCSGNL